MDSVDDAMLKEKTEDYWDRLADNYRDPLGVWRYYVTNLLPLEMLRHKTDKTDDTSCDTLVLLVGYSVEPLLQAVWFYQPRQVVLILNQHYGRGLTGDNFYIYLLDLLGRLPEELRPAKHAIHKVMIKEATPAAVFSALVAEVGKQTKVVVDMTGAKKSMVAGAFLYAAYAKVPVSYVDFDDEVYSTRYNRPYGYASIIHQFANPYEQFALRDWERIRQLYGRYHFADAGALVAGLIESPAANLYAGIRDFSKALHKLKSILHIYRLWDEGNFRGAAKALQDIEATGLIVEVPTAVKVLAEVWPFAHQNDAQSAADDVLQAWKQLAYGKGGDPRKSFFYQDTWLLTYIQDELARICRLWKLNEDCRSAFLRLAAINEVLLKARLVRLWVDGDVQMPSGCDELTKLKHLIDMGTAGNMLNVLRDIKPWTQYANLRYGLELRSEAQRMEPFWEEPGCQLNMEAFTTLRDRTVHTYLAIAPSLVEAAFDLIERNLKEYCQRWHKGVVPHVETAVMPWPKLCQLCGVDVFLPPNLLQEVSNEISTSC
ncbi:MAG TPA: hypothetical protein PKV20_02545 [Anaerolineae bacterium]|nr:hypothetical protein [Anaerolineae bacterium]